MTLVASGGKHTLALTSENRVYAFGSNAHGQLGLGLDEYEAQDCPREVVYFREKIVSWLAAGSAHSVALSIEGYAYTWGRNALGPLGTGPAISDRSDERISCPKILDAVLGIGVAQACANYNQTFLGCAERLKNKPDTSVFTAWKAKLKKHEERQALLASQEYR